jgi:cell division protein FtsB
MHYLGAFAAFVVWMLFFDQKDYFTQVKRKKEVETLEEKKAFYQKQIATTRKQIEALDRDPAMLEKFAREKYYMKRDDEDVYIIEIPEKPSASKKKAASN